MKTPPRLPDCPAGHRLARELFTVDADAHLEKLAAHMFPSPALLPVELVRSALKRNAAAVSIQVSSARFVISDNGSGIEKEEWQALACLGDSQQDAAARENAMALIQGAARPGLGLLAVFLPGWLSIQIENAAAFGASTLLLKNGRSRAVNSSHRTGGTRITVWRRRGPAAEEKILLARLCAAVQAEIEINSRPLQKKPLLTGNLVSMELTVQPDLPQGQLAVPVQGDVCRLWLLDQGIPWQVTNSAAAEGLVFSAALETGAAPAPSTLEALSNHADRLYLWLAENYASFPESHQARIEELFYKRIRFGGDPALLSLCAPFRTWPQQRRLTLSDLRRQAESGSLYALDLASRFGRSSGWEKEVLLLTTAQKDFLIDQLRLPITILNAPQRNEIHQQRALALLQSATGRFFARRLPARTVDVHGLSREEISLCRELEAHWRRELVRNDPGAALAPLAVVMIEGRGWAAARWLKTGDGDMLQVRRRHPLTRRAMSSMQRNSHNIELVFAALMPDYFLTGRRQ